MSNNKETRMRKALDELNYLNFWLGTDFRVRTDVDGNGKTRARLERSHEDGGGGI